MKKHLCLFVILVMIFLLSACDPSHYYHTIEDYQSVERIELINYNNPNQKQFLSWVPDHYGKLVGLDLDNITVLEILDSNFYPRFINDLGSLDILYRYYAYDSPKDKCIRIIYTNGKLDIITANYKNSSYAGYIGRYSSAGEVVDFYGCFDNLTSFIDLVNDYFIQKIEIEE
ncbi:MAG: hypothetical protein WC006_09110 [Bacilli bacterium]|nr:hypothetical protein [Bacilli bacterium]